MSRSVARRRRKDHKIVLVRNCALCHRLAHGCQTILQIGTPIRVAHLCSTSSTTTTTTTMSTKECAICEKTVGGEYAHRACGHHICWLCHIPLIRAGKTFCTRCPPPTLATEDVSGNLVTGSDGEQNLVVAQMLRAEREKVCPKRPGPCGCCLFCMHACSLCADREFGVCACRERAVRS